MIAETERKAFSGLAVLPFLILFTGVAVYSLVQAIQSRDTVLIVTATVVTVFFVICWAGFFMVHPNQGVVLQLFGKYVGTVRDPGLRWANPFYSKTPVSLRLRNFESGKLKVNDNLGNPVEIASVVVWKVVDTAEAVFEVDDYKNYVHIQTESALRNLATGYPYDQHEEGEISLRSHTVEIADRLKREIQERLALAGVSVLEARISHLAYAPEIAHAMLQRQQATAIIAARQKIVEGAVGMVEMALDLLAERGVVELDEERKVAMISNLLVVLCGDQNAHPVINTGSLYQ